MSGLNDLGIQTVFPVPVMFVVPLKQLVTKQLEIVCVERMYRAVLATHAHPIISTSRNAKSAAVMFGALFLLSLVSVLLSPP